ncbi:MAG TPA: tyrosine--tRNA ligase [Syntrophales bacterium]|jgi:tyrosyl-tRNA synthetase|nr:tyrosine--tRNA ligase [Syntrophales bacterium]HPC32919.1 tyrosine--tRNA ligase [Syntrophales bacterium]HQG34176.1 tyrosine--tRNA ligase [Syntrophales bacterium]HQI36164.1 tyrosine--tRNA ligase [Syntrophales bacterium]HRR47600.1 tyrosine--tRNA ligase [Syntrophales bacterium]
MKNVYDVFRERGFVEQVTDEDAIAGLLDEPGVTCYIGFDPTATSLHIGSLVPIMALAHMQRHGHRPIALVGGGTGLIGDPSGKTEMRQILTRAQIDFNAQCLQQQLSRYLDFRDGKAMLLNNADWLTKLNYIEFLRDIGRHFSVNKMLAAESYKMRLEKGLNFIEFNYMLLQAYDFLYLFKNHNCLIQMGGNDQWGNMLAGSDLIRRMEGKAAYSMTFPLITTSAGHKMGKTERGTVWLDAALTPPYEYYQYWVNTEDDDVERFLCLFTFLPVEEIREVRKLADVQLNMAKTVLAFEATKITHGETAAVEAWQASVQAFKTRIVDRELFPSSSIPRKTTDDDLSAIPSLEKPLSVFEHGVPAYELFYESGLCSSRGEARRLIEQGGAYINEIPINAFDEKITANHVSAQGLIRLRKGKKKHFLVIVKN